MRDDLRYGLPTGGSSDGHQAQGSSRTVMCSSRWTCRQAAVRVLVAEDDEGLRSVLERGLRENGYAVDATSNGEQALNYLRTYDYDVAILDWRMPVLSGLDVIRRLRQSGSALPILMLTARDAASDRVAGLDEGADDYLVKPFDFGELLARVRALQRREPVLKGLVISVGDLHLDTNSREVSFGSSRPHLTATELSILEILMRRSPAVVRRRSIALAVWDEEADALGSNTIDVHLTRLRAKLASSGAKIETIRATGYRIFAV